MKRSSKKQSVPEVTPTMMGCLHAMLASSSKSLYRWKGGFWATQPRPAGPQEAFVPSYYFTTSTVHGLIDRGAVDVSVSRGGGSSFPSEIRLNHVSYEVMKCKQPKN